MNTNNCKFNRTCKKHNTEECNIYCYPYVLLHGTDGKGGFWAVRNVPKKYSDCLRENLPIEKDNPSIYRAVMGYMDNIIFKVMKESRGLYFQGGTGNGKTTTAITIMNEYLIERCKLHLRGEQKIEVTPVLFVRLSEVQNLYNSQFRGSQDLQNEGSMRFYNFKKRMKEVELLVIDDIALRGCPEGFQNELYDILDKRAIEDLTTIFTSNVSYEELPEYIGDRITSRIQGMAGKAVVFKGSDNRIGGLF